MLIKKNGIYKKLMISAVISVLCMSALHVAAVSTPSFSEYNISRVDSRSFTREKCTYERALTKEKPRSINPIIAASQVDTPIITTENDCQNPAVVTRGNDILVIAEESQSVFASDLLMTYSSDGGNTWSDIIYDFSTEDVKEIKPVIDYCSNNEFQAYGTCLPDPITKTLYLLHFPSMTDPDMAYKDSEGWTPWQLELYDFNDFYSIDIGGYPHGENAPAQDFHGIIVLIGDSSSYGETLENYYETEGNSVGACYLEFEGWLGDTVTTDIDVSTETYFDAMEVMDDPDIGIEDGVFLESCWVEPGNENWWENDWLGFIFEGAHNPDLAADDGNCYCVCEVDGGIVCYYSHDNGESFQSTTVATTGQFPAVSASGKTVVCSYTRNGDVYASLSEDGGITWEEFPVLNDASGTVVEQEYCLDVAGSSVVWTDDQNGNTQIYFDKADVAVPLIEIESVSGKIGVSAVIENTGTADATDVQWSIDLEGLVFPKSKSGTLPTVAAGDQVVVKTGLVFGLGSITITVAANEKKEIIDGTVFLIFVNV